MTNDTTTLAQRETPSLVRPEEPEVVTVTPRVDVYENHDEILLIADFPGVPKDSLWVGLDGSELVIEGMQLAHEGQPRVRPMAFSRTFRIPNTVDPNGVSAELAEGVLRVHLAKSEAAKPKRIEVRSA
jgi:HSP20 family protein